MVACSVCRREARRRDEFVVVGLDAEVEVAVIGRRREVVRSSCGFGGVQLVVPRAVVAGGVTDVGRAEVFEAVAVLQGVDGSEEDAGV